MTDSELSRREFVRRSIGAAAFMSPTLLASAGVAAEARRFPIVTAEGLADLPSLVLPHDSGAQVELLLQGAHVTSWKIANGEEMLFASEQVQPTPGVAFRGGIPVVFPQFANLGPLPLHGFLQTQTWRVAESGVSPEGAVYAVLQSEDSDATRALWPHRFLAEVRVELDQGLAMSLKVTNRGDSPFTFASALHTYHRVGDVRRVTVHGVEGLRYLDRREAGVEKAGDPSPLRLTGSTDRVFVSAPNRIQLRDDSLARTILIEKQGFADAVVWNPWARPAQTPPSATSQDWEHFLCVEPANVSTSIRVEPGELWQGVQTLRVEQDR